MLRPIRYISGLLSVVPVTTGTHPRRLPPDQHGHTKPTLPSFRPVAAGLKPALRGHCRQSNAATRSQPCLVPRHGKSISGLLSVVPVTTGTHPQRLPPDQRRRTKPPPPSFRTVAAGLNPPPRSLPSVQRRHTKPPLPRAHLPAKCRPFQAGYRPKLASTRSIRDASTPSSDARARSAIASSTRPSCP